ncbi:MAG: sterol desaturase family protein [Daejeonella sp.]|uniref:sterol desaturase family protein n=1 Tax=Daejeonella sp. TaxID=2805397 RepID=UPI003C731AD3
MNEIKEIILNSYTGYFNYLKNEILYPGWDNYFYGLIIISLLVWSLEIIFPWRKDQAIFRKDFWLDLFYLFFNFFLLNLILLIALSETAAHLLNRLLFSFGITLEDLKLFELNDFPFYSGLILFFIVADFIQWNTHRLLHRVGFLWNFHKIHHSAKQMGFATHMRFHWMEPVLYKSILYIPLAMIGGLNARDVIFVHYFSIVIGHLNHANIGWNYGKFKYILNNPKMHVWHHTKSIPNKYGVNFGISLSLWDYIFKTDYVPQDGRDNELGFIDDHEVPEDFLAQELYPLKL